MNEIERSAKAANGGLGSELLYFLKQSRKWWLVPILIAFVVFAGLMLLSTTAVAPFIYTLF